jgi:hypothetical protein
MELLAGIVIGLYKPEGIVVFKKMGGGEIRTYLKIDFLRGSHFEPRTSTATAGRILGNKRRSLMP